MDAPNLACIDSYVNPQNKHGLFQEVDGEEAEAGPPHEVLFLVLAYLPVFELLSMSAACVSLRNAVSQDILPWLDTIVETPLNSCLTDRILTKITSKANGRLRTLALINCVKITDHGLQQVIDLNPFINQLHIPACTGLTPEGVIRAVTTLSQHHSRNLMSIKINGIYNINKQHLEQLQSYLQNKAMIDVEVCPKCDEVRKVYDECPRKSCKLKSNCTACNHCIPRCEECGVCFIGTRDEEEQEESVCGDILCLTCWLKLPKCNLCNKPYCKRHANCSTLTTSLGDAVGFVCEVCHEKSIGISDYEME